MDYIWPLLDLSQSRALFIRDSIRTDMWGPLVSGASGSKFSMGGKYAAEAENISSKWAFYPQPKGIPLPHLSRVFVTIFPRGQYQLPLESVPASTSHLSPFPSTEGHRDGASTASAPNLLSCRPLSPHRSCFPVGHCLRTRSTSPSSTTSAPELLPRSTLPPHRSCFPVVHYLRTGSASLSASTCALDLLPIGHYLRTRAAPCVG